jgi:hypothetical protein
MKDSNFTINNQEFEMWKTLLENHLFHTDLVKITFIENNLENNSYFVI